MAHLVKHHPDEPKKERDYREKKEQIEIDMNPMVDLAFLLLTFFMLTTTFSQPQTMEIVMPAKPEKDAVEKEQPVKESKTVTIILGKEDRVYWFQGITDPDVQETDYSKDGLRKVLLQKKSEITDMVVLIKPDNTSNYKNLVDVLDEMHITDIGRYAIVDITPADKELIASL